MRRLSKPVAATLLLGFLGVNVFVTLCVMGATGMPECPMQTADSEGPGWSAGYDCCVSCLARATLPTNVGFGAPIGLPAPPSSNIDSFSADSLAFEFDREIPQVSASASPPVFLLNSTFLI